MAFGLHKPGQGYWARVISACVAGAMVIALAAWTAEQVGAADLVPARAWMFSVEAGGQAPAPGDRVALTIDAEPGSGLPQSTGEGVVEAVGSEQAGRRLITVRDVSIPGSAGPQDVDHLAVAGAAAGPGSSVAGVSAVPVFDPLYLSAGLAIVIILGGGALVYWLIGVRAGTVEFLISTDGEMKKVNWSTRREIVGSTWVVIGASALLVVALYGIDQVFARLFQLIGVLDSF